MVGYFRPLAARYTFADRGGENGYAKTGIVDFPRGNSVFVCVGVLRPRLTSMVMPGRLVN